MDLEQERCTLTDAEEERKFELPIIVAHDNKQFKVFAVNDRIGRKILRKLVSMEEDINVFLFWWSSIRQRTDTNSYERNQEGQSGIEIAIGRCNINDDGLYRSLADLFYEMRPHKDELHINDSFNNITDDFRGMLQDFHVFRGREKTWKKAEGYGWNALLWIGYIGAAVCGIMKAAKLVILVTALMAVANFYQGIEHRCGKFWKNLECKEDVSTTLLTTTTVLVVRVHVVHLVEHTIKANLLTATSETMSSDGKLEILKALIEDMKMLLKYAKRRLTRQRKKSVWQYLGIKIFEFFIWSFGFNLSWMLKYDSEVLRLFWIF